MCRRTVAAMMTIPLLLTAACERQPDTTPAFQHEIRDSAGIRIIQNPLPDPDSRLGWQVGTEPVFTIGSVEAEEAFQLHRVDDALKLGDGRIVVANGGSHQLLVFDEGGNYLTAWGQKGAGPGDLHLRLGWQVRPHARPHAPEPTPNGTPMPGCAPERGAHRHPSPIHTDECNTRRFPSKRGIPRA